ncbi:MAG: CHAT domain-containing protein [Rhodothermaceae bacterium]|nr:CHAT domain-containing protein [Rhodothermaceae bacterium]
MSAQPAKSLLLLLLILLFISASPAFSQDQQRDSILKEATQLYEEAVNLEQGSNYASALEVAGKGLDLLIPYVEIPTDIAQIKTEFPSQTTQAQAALLYLNSHLQDLTISYEDRTHLVLLDAKANRYLKRARLRLSKRKGYAEANRRVDYALSEHESILTMNHKDYMEYLGKVGVRYWEFGQYEKAAEYLQEQFDLYNQVFSEITSLQFKNRIEYGSVLVDMEDYNEAEELLLGMLESAEDLNASPYARYHIYNSMFRLHLAQEDTVRALEYEELAAALSDDLIYDMDVEGSLDEESYLYYKRFEQMEEDMARSDSLHWEAVIKSENNPVEAARDFREIAVLTSRMRDLAGDMQSNSDPFMYALMRMGVTNSMTIAVSGLMTLATQEGADQQVVDMALEAVLEHKGKLLDRSVDKQALYLEDADPITQRLFQTVQERARRVAQYAYVAPVLPDIATEEAPEPEPVEEQVAEEGGKKKKGGLLKRVSKSVGKTLNQAGSVVGKGARTAKGGITGDWLNSDSLAFEYVEVLYALRKEQEEAYRALNARVDILPFSESIDINTLKGKLGSGTTLADVIRFFPYDLEAMVEVAKETPVEEWFRYNPEWLSVPERYAVFTLESNKIPNLIDLGEATPIDSLVTLYQAHMAEAGRTLLSGSREEREGIEEEYKQIGSALFETVFQPIGISSSSVYWSPDGLLRVVPAETFIDSNGNYLIDTYSFSYLSTGRDLVTFSKPTMSNDFQVVSNVDFGSSSNASPSVRSGSEILTESLENELWPELRYAKDEGDLIQSYLKLPESRVIEGENASESTLYELDPSYGLHLTTHGFFFEHLADTVMSMESVYALLYEFQRQLFPRSNALKEVEEPEEKKKGKLLGRIVTNLDNPVSRTLKTAQEVNDSVVNIQESINNADAFMDDMVNLPKRASAIRMDLARWVDPLFRSGLVLAGRNEYTQARNALGIEDGLATAYELAWADLSGTGVVVMSACDTGKGGVVNGEGVFGLGRSFQIAGSQSVIMSLWQVSDGSTMNLMTNFYEQMASGKGKAASLRTAAREVKEQLPHPYFWGPFIAMGNPD